MPNFEFKKINQIQLEESLKNICKENKIDFEQQALNLKAIKSEGSSRDCLLYTYDDADDPP